MRHWKSGGKTKVLDSSSSKESRRGSECPLLSPPSASRVKSAHAHMESLVLFAMLVPPRRQGQARHVRAGWVRHRGAVASGNQLQHSVPLPPCSHISCRWSRQDLLAVSMKPAADACPMSTLRQSQPPNLFLEVFLKQPPLPNFTSAPRSAATRCMPHVRLVTHTCTPQPCNCSLWK